MKICSMDFREPNALKLLQCPDKERRKPGCSQCIFRTPFWNSEGLILSCANWKRKRKRRPIWKFLASDWLMTEVSSRVVGSYISRITVTLRDYAIHNMTVTIIMKQRNTSYMKMSHENNSKSPLMYLVYI